MKTPSDLPASPRTPQLTDLRPDPRQRVQVLIADDSPTVRHHLTGILNRTPGLVVIGEARDGEEVLRLVPQLKPQVVSMDIRMPRMDGLEATRRLMMEYPVPVVVVSGLVDTDLDLAFQALQAGALAVVARPPDRSHPNFAEQERQLVKTLSAMAAVKVIRRGRTGQLDSEFQRPGTGNLLPGGTGSLRLTPELIAVGASTGGPGALNILLRLLPADLPVPVVIVQHMPDEFIAGLARWIGKSSGREVRVVTDNAQLEPGVVHLSPGTAHLTVRRQGTKLVATLIPEPGGYRHQPAIDVLFDSVAQTCGAAAVGVLLTGMGDDGAAGLLTMRQAGARTFAQDRASATVFGMPGAAVERGAVEQELSPARLALAISRLF